jgi:hypothetical protein
VLLVAAVVAGLAWGIPRLLEKDGFEVGDCVEVVPRTTDSDLKGVDCPSSWDPYSEVYEIGAVLDGAHSSCYTDALVEFSHEPDDKTYCLVAPSSAYGGAGVDASPDETGGGDYTGDGEPPECVEARLDGDVLPPYCEGG